MSVSDIAISILLALTHGVLECVFLYMEAQASKTSFVNYCIICFNGRFGWVPYNDYLISTSQKMFEEGQDQEQRDKKRSDKVELDFRNIESRLFCFDLQVEFTFSNATINSLSKTLAAFPPLQNEKDMPIIRFGHTVNDVSLENLEGLLRVCKGKIMIDLKGTDLYRMFKDSKHSNLLECRNASDLSAEDNEYLFELQKSGLYQLLFFILNYNNENLRAETEDPETKQKWNFALMAYHRRNSELLELLLCLNSPIFKSQLATVENRMSLTVRILNTVDFDMWVALASNSDTFNPHQESLIFQAFMNQQMANPAQFRRSMQWWHVRFGPGMPQEIIHDVSRFSNAHDFMKEYKKMYP